MTTILLNNYLGFLWDLPSPITLSYLWGFGSFLGIIIVTQVISGFLLAFYYVSGPSAWGSVIELTREVYLGWLLRLVHSNTASFVFIILFAHFLRGLTQASFYLNGPWISGWLIMLLTMGAAFLGYVLPWGQISFWGATVIINLLSVLPIGNTLVVWLWGGFYVSEFTCSFFFALHYILPFSALGIAAVHLLLLHSTGSSSFNGSSNSTSININFGHLFSYNDAINLSILWLIWIILLYAPDWAADPINFLNSDLSTSPLHIQPEWYFLHYYAVLRSIPNNVGGLIAFGLAFAALIFLTISNSNISIVNLENYSVISWTFISINIILIWLGSQPIEEPFTLIGLSMTYMYFTNLLLIVSLDTTLILLYDTMD